jgi:hypothetical protein|nr:MAG TPA: hypothetical protein [Caudoviricetes sp.]DAO68874.1 MAG TPA: hypothetical protein [Caudoviricetes sp.]
MNRNSLAAAILSLVLQAKPAKPACETNGAGWPKFNQARSRNSYGDFSWQITREKGRPVAVIQHKGRLYARLVLCPGYGYRAMQTEIVEWLDDRMACEAGRLSDGQQEGWDGN